MTRNAIIRAEGLGKKFLIGHQSSERTNSFREAIGNTLSGLLRSAGAMARGQQLVAGDTVEEFWALRNLDFSILEGEVVGIIGRNGAGKSTLLKILSRITEPSEGRVELTGRVASLLEVGTGFHNELTGRENIYLNGSILGMTRADINRKFDEIVDFSGVERFLDTPIKRYSSGMAVRLAFSVAAHLEPEILVVDEVLAVGDADFQKKSLGKMGEVASSGRTVLFVSHNMAAVRDLCTRALHLQGGTIIEDGDVNTILAGYLRKGPEHWRAIHNKSIIDGLVLESVRIDPDYLVAGDPQVIFLNFRSSKSGYLRECTLNIYSQLGTRLAIVDTREGGPTPFGYQVGCFTVKVIIESLPLIEGDYSIGLWISTNEFTGLIDNIVHLSVAGKPQNLDFASYPPDLRGYIALSSTTSVDYSAEGSQESGQ